MDSRARARRERGHRSRWGLGGGVGGVEDEDDLTGARPVSPLGVGLTTPTIRVRPALAEALDGHAGCCHAGICALEQEAAWGCPGSCDHTARLSDFPSPSSRVQQSSARKPFVDMLPVNKLESEQ